MEQLRVGIIGAGGITAKMHLPEMQTVPNAEVTVISGRRQSRLTRLSEHFNVPFYTRSYEKVVNDPKVDAVIIALPPPLHVEWGLKAIQAGKHVYMQKPLCISLEEADQFVRAVELSDRIVFCLPHLSRPHVLATQQIIRQGDVGVVSSLRARHSHGGPEVYYAGIQQFFGEPPEQDLWFFDDQRAGAGALLDMGVYSLSTLVALGGTVSAVTARCLTVAKQTRLEDTAAILLDFQSGSLGVAETGWCDAARTSEFSVHGTAGKVVSNARESELTLLRPGSATDEDSELLTERVDTSRFPRQNSHQQWANCIGSKTPPIMSNARTGRHLTEILLAALESSRSRRTVELNTDVNF